MRRAAILVAAIGITLGCRSPSCPRPCGPRPTTAAHLLERIRRGDAEGRYHATLALRRYDTEDVRSSLRALLVSEEPLTRNAAARSLAALGEESAAGVLIANLDRRERTWAVTDAIYHLRELFGTDRGYDPNRGYRHQAEVQAQWWSWFDGRGHARPPEKAWPDVDAHATLYDTLSGLVKVYAANEGVGDEADWDATAALWKAVGELAPSREPAHVSLVAEAFGIMAARWPNEANLWNNHALASLNDGRYTDALASYGQAIELAPTDAYLRNDRGILLEALGRLGAAEASYREAIRLDPEDATWRGNLGDVLAAQGRRDEAIRAYRQAERLKPESWYYHRLPIQRLGRDVGP